jgi:glucose/galactose transporter
MSIICGLFFVFGFVTWLNGVLIPFLQLACDLSDAQALLVTFAFYMAYFCLALPASAILDRTGFKKGMALGLAVMAAGALLCIPAAGSRSFALFLTGLFVQGMGLAFLQTASNPYASVIGPIESAAQRISIMGICNKVAGVLGSLLFATLLLGGADEIKEKAVALAGQISELKAAAVQNAAALASAEGERQALLDALAQRVVTPYIVIIVVLLVLAFFVMRSPLPEIDTAKSNASAGGAAGGRDSVLRYPHLFLGVLCLFLYVGVEVMAGDAVSLYGKSSGMPLEQTKFLTSYTLAAMVVGYVAGIIAIPRWLKQENALGLCAVLGAAFTAGAFATSGMTLAVFGIPLSVAFVCLLGLANSLMWPAIFPLAISGLGRFTNLGSAFLVMAIAGGALIPQFYAHSQDWFGISAQTAFLVCMLPCYAYILYYALAGHKAARK